MLKKFLPLILLLALSYWSVKSLFSPGFFSIHDDTQVQRVFEMHKSLSDGMFPVRWVADLGYGYGYPIFNYYAPLAYYMGSFFMFLGFDSLIATKLMMGSGIIMAGVFMYLFAREFWGEKGGILSGLLYVYAPYHALNIYVRGDVAEFFAYAFIPVTFLAVYKIFSGLKSKSISWYWVTISAVSYAAIILSHNLTAMMISPFIITYSIILYINLRRREKLYKPYFVFLGLFIGILLSAFYWLPVFPELAYTNVLSVVGGGSKYKDHFVCIQQLWSSPWGFGGSAPGCIDGMSFKIGKLHILLSALSLVLLTLIYKKSRTKFMTMAFCIAAIFICIFLTIGQSKFIWDAIPHMAFFQFPWRFLLLISFYSSFLGGAILWALDQDKRSGFLYLQKVAPVIIGLAVVFLNYGIFIPSKTMHIKSSDLTNKDILNWTTSKISDEYMPKGFAYPYSQADVPVEKVRKNKKARITILAEKTQELTFVSDSKDNVDLVVNTAYFPTWHVFIDGEQVEFKYFSKGLIISVPKGKHKVNVVFSQTTVQNVGNIVSIAGVGMLIVGIIVAHKKKRIHAK